MKRFIYVLIPIVILSISLRGQCPPANSTTTISGLFSSDLNPAPGSKIYITSSGTITGNINLNNSSLYNCGTILSKKITMRQNVQNNQYVLENNNMMKCDTISLDSLGHLHNNDTLLCRLFRLNYNTAVDNNYLMDVNNIIVEKESKLYSQGTIIVNYFDMKDSYSNFFNIFGNVSARKLFRVGAGTFFYGTIFACIDSCFINNGVINNSLAQGWSPSIRVMGQSVNNGTIYTIDFCDLSSSNGGMPDVNTGTLSSVTFCATQQFYCNLVYSSVKENDFTETNVLVFPNPTSNDLHIQTNNFEFGDSEIQIINYLGQTVLKQPFSETISVAELSSGYYTLLISTANGQFHSKFIKN